MKCLSALAFVRPEAVAATFDVLQDRFEADEGEILSYFRNTWVARPQGRRERPSRSPSGPSRWWGER